MTHKIDRLQLIRERHRKLILEPRKKVAFDVFDDDWADDLDPVDEQLLARQVPSDNGDDE